MAATFHKTWSSYSAEVIEGATALV